MSIFVLRLDTTQPHSYILKNPSIAEDFLMGGKYNHLTATYGIVWQILPLGNAHVICIWTENKEIKVTIVLYIGIQLMHLYNKMIKSQNLS